ncbi:hypothetical protein KQX54_016990 [Cotesia glomerata]|uniref:Uncharacterized protein n=1 Tax=Cotesia glomerata TaxID=32391 RepID=A0AAV7IAG1_COTGL|nr:hypothetical protein KQX54_016990 [Cotesia glomerata]
MHFRQSRKFLPKYPSIKKRQRRKRRLHVNPVFRELSSWFCVDYHNYGYDYETPELINVYSSRCGYLGFRAVMHPNSGTISQLIFHDYVFEQSFEKQRRSWMRTALNRVRTVRGTEPTCAIK